MKIVSMVPSATEILFALGLGDEVKGVSSDCDYPPAARSKPVVSGSALTLDEHQSARRVDRAVTDRVNAGQPIYTLDAARVEAIQPDLILAQDLCRVCAVPSGAVKEALAVLGCQAQVLSLDPSTLDEVIESIGAVGEATGTAEQARVLMDGLRARIDTVRAAVAGRLRPRTLALEWSDPPFCGGHWVPDMVIAAGGEPVLSVPGAPSRPVSWDDVANAQPEVVVFMPCGYELDDASDEGRLLVEMPELSATARIVAVNASALFSRPGPRVVAGLEALAWGLHPDVFPPPPPGTAIALRGDR